MITIKFAAHIHAPYQKNTLDFIPNAVTKANQSICCFFRLALSYLQGLEL